VLANNDLELAAREEKVREQSEMVPNVNEIVADSYFTRDLPVRVP